MVRKTHSGSSTWLTLVLNLIVAIVFVCAIHVVHSAWWVIGIVGAGVGVLTEQVVRRNREG